MSKKELLEQEELEKVSGGMMKTNPDDNDSPININVNDPVGKKQYMVEYREMYQTGRVDPSTVKAQYIGWHDTELSADNAGRYWCSVNNKRKIGIRLMRPNESAS